jgi:hypothetical protein
MHDGAASDTWSSQEESGRETGAPVAPHQRVARLPQSDPAATRTVPARARSQNRWIGGLLQLKEEARRSGPLVITHKVLGVIDDARSKSGFAERSLRMGIGHSSSTISTGGWSASSWAGNTGDRACLNSPPSNLYEGTRGAGWHGMNSTGYLLDRPWDRAPAAKDWARVLAALPLFSKCSKRQLRTVAQLARFEESPPGQVVIQAGDPPDAFHLTLRSWTSGCLPTLRPKA